MFQEQDTVKHIKTGGLYYIIGTPKQFVIEKTGEPAYAYASIGFEEKTTVLVKSQEEMEWEFIKV